LPKPSAVHPAQQTRLRAATLSLAVGFGMLGLKMSAYWLTGSAAILSDALESVVHVFATGFALFSVYVAALPPDRSHPYGHGKVEYFSAGFEGALIMLAALVICYDAGQKLLRGARPSELDVGTAMIALAAVINLVLGLYLIRVGKRTTSITLVADGRHVLTDSYTSLAVIVGLLIILITGWAPLDALVALGVAVNILVAGGLLVFQSIRGLMDAADPQLLTRLVAALEQRRQSGWIDIHRMRALQIGEARNVDLHLTVPRFWDVEQTHAQLDELAELFKTTLPGSTTLFAHLDPCVDACCDFCSYEPCPIRTRPFSGRLPWTLEHAVAPAHYPPDAEREP
jgi:cation diffusion facilitator family transporter